MCKDEGLACEGVKIPKLNNITPSCEQLCEGVNNKIVIRHGDAPIFSITQTTLEQMINDVLTWAEDN